MDFDRLTMVMRRLALEAGDRIMEIYNAPDFEVRSKSGTAYMGVDGEALEAETPLRFRIHPQGLRMYVPNGNIESAEFRRSRHLRFGDLVSVALGKEPRRGGGT